MAFYLYLYIILGSLAVIGLWAYKRFQKRTSTQAEPVISQSPPSATVPALNPYNLKATVSGGRLYCPEEPFEIWQSHLTYFGDKNQWVAWSENGESGDQNFQRRHIYGVFENLAEAISCINLKILNTGKLGYRPLTNEAALISKNKVQSAIDLMQAAHNLDRFSKDT